MAVPLPKTRDTMETTTLTSKATLLTSTAHTDSSTCVWAQQNKK